MSDRGVGAPPARCSGDAYWYVDVVSAVATPNPLKQPTARVVHEDRARLDAAVNDTAVMGEGEREATSSMIDTAADVVRRAELSAVSRVPLRNSRVTR